MIPANPSEFSVWSFKSQSGRREIALNLGVHCTKKRSLVFTIYCPFLMVNKTGNFLTYKVINSSSDTDTSINKKVDFKISVFPTSSPPRAQSYIYFHCCFSVRR